MQHVTGRESWIRMQERLEASDVGKDYLLLCHPPRLTILEHFRNCLRTLYATEADICVRLEDDCSDINLHLLHNIRTWGALSDPRFGAGWLLRIGGCIKQEDIWHEGPLHASLGVVFRREMLPTIFEASGELPQDLQIGDVCRRVGKQIAIHHPSLVENDVSVASTMGHQSHHNIIDHTSFGSFDRDWKR